MIPDLAISSCWNSSHHEDGYAMMTELAELGFNSVELGHGTRYSLWPGILQAHQEKIVRIVSLHNFCPLPLGFTRPSPNCYEFSDPRPQQRARALKHSLETIDHAAAFGARSVVLHLGSTGQRPASRPLEQLYHRGRFLSRSYVKTKLHSVIAHEAWLKNHWPRIEDSLLELLAKAASLNIQLGLECREAIEEVPLDSAWLEILTKLPPPAGYWHDFGHAARKDALGYIDHEQHLSELAPRLIGCHLHDMIAPDRDHQPLGTGGIPFAKLWPLLKKAPSPPVYVLELSPRVTKDAVRESLLWWKQNGPDLY
ncbi:MAG: sugar phosphate isomerase/epimerase [Blastochloris sp.]|nr:sugar phosphate isomerase/epimerase [Blastochloris sp.]